MPLNAKLPVTALNVPELKVRVTLIAEVNWPVPEVEKLERLAISSTFVPAVVCARIIFVVPKAIERVKLLFELNVPVVNVNPFKDNVPFVRVNVDVATSVSAVVSCNVPPTES